VADEHSAGQPDGQWAGAEELQIGRANLLAGRAIQLVDARAEQQV
jgi:hypothetical protein